MGLYSKEFGYQFILSLAASLFVLGVMRVLAIKYSPARNQWSHIFLPEEGQLAKAGLRNIFVITILLMTIINLFEDDSGIISSQRKSVR